MKVYPEKCKGLGPEAIRARACNLVKKMMLKGKSAKRINSENKKFYQNSEPEMVEVLKKKYELGLLSEEELYSRMDELSKKSTSDQAKFNATKEMRQWVREAKSEIEANKLSALEIVPLMVDALTELPRLKYVEVLKGVRAKRLAKNSERGIVYNPDEIREKQRRDVMFRGAKRRGFEI
jgi:predicted transcriptional regulator